MHLIRTALFTAPVLMLAACVDPAEEHVYEPVETCPIEGGLSYRAPERSNVMLVIDRSGSMEGEWPTLVQLSPLVEQLGAVSNLGASFFPNEFGGCSVDELIEVPVGENNGDDVIFAIENSTPFGHTPMAKALSEVRRQAALRDPYRENVVVLVADGVPTCGEKERDVIKAVEGFNKLDEPVTMHFVSFADDPEAAQVLRRAAESADDGVFHEASNVSELYETLARVGASLDSCSYVLDEPVATIEVRLNGTAIDACTSADCVEGYGYDNSTGIVSLAPITCRQAASETCPDLQIHKL